MKKVIKYLLLIMVMLIPFRVEAKDYKLMISYFSNGGTISSGNVEIISGVVFEKNSIKSDITYTSNQTITHINSLDGNNIFTLKKGNDIQTKNKEWYAENYLTGKKVYFSNSKSYTVKDIVKKLNLDTAYYEETGLPLEIYLNANYAKPISIRSVELNTSIKTISKGKTFKLNTKFYPSNATDKTVTWSSEDPTIATVDQSGNVRGIKGGKTKIVVKTNDGGKIAKCLVTVHDESTIKVTGIKLSKSKVELLVGKSEVVTATISPSNAINKNVKWTSSNTKIATVSNGKITGKAKGSATITATTADGNKKAKVTVKVTDNKVTGITLNKTKETMNVGESITLTEKITPSNATNKAVTWTSSNKTIATVSSKGTVKALKKGKVTITVTTKDGNKKAKCVITIEDKKQSNNKVILFVGNSKTSQGDIPGITGKMAAAGGQKVAVKSITKGGATLKTISNEYATKLKDIKYDYLVLQEQTDSYLNSDISLYLSGVKSIINTTTKKSDNSKIYIRALWGLDKTKQAVLNNAYNNTNNIAKSVGAKPIYDGKAWDLSRSRNKYNLFTDTKHPSKYGAYLSAATIYATIYNKSPIGNAYYGSLTKTQATDLQKIAHEIVFGAITVSPKTTSVQVGKVKQVTAKAIPESKVTWKSSNSKIATVNSAGVVEGKKKGNVTITASANKSSDTVKVTVQNEDILTQNTINMYKYRYYDFKVFLQPNVGKATWTSKNKSVAEVTSNGIVHALKDGTTEIVAKTSKGEESIKVKVTTQTNNKKYNLSSCSTMDVKSKGTKLKLYNCIPDVELKNPSDGKRHQIQSISISNNYIYYASPMNGAWLYEHKGTINNTDDANTRKITTIYVARVPRSGNEMRFMQVEYAGHGQGLDTAGLTSNGNELLYMNLAAKFNDKTGILVDKVVRGTIYRGVGITTFIGSTNKANLRHPGTVITINGVKTGFTLNKKTTNDFKSKDTFSEKLYYDYLKSVAKNTNLRSNPETSVDEVNKRVAVRTSNQVLVYNESDFRSGKGKPKYTFKIENTGTQGDDIYGYYFYTINGMTDATIKKYDIRTGQKVAETTIDFTEFLKDNAYINMEPEGLSFNNGQLYAGIVTRVCTKYEGNQCGGKISYNTIAKVTGM